MNSNDMIALSDLETGGRGTVVGLEGEGRFLGHMLYHHPAAQRRLFHHRLLGERGGFFGRMFRHRRAVPHRLLHQRIIEEGRGFLGRMAALGFNPGATIEVVRNDGFGPLIVSILDTQIALGRGQASKIYVRREGR